MPGFTGPLNRLDEFRYEIPQSYRTGMRTSAIIYSDAAMLESIRQDNAPEQAANVAHLPGIVGKSLAMPDIHWGYGFPIGGVAAFGEESGVISPGGVGFDINCGVRLLRTTLSMKESAQRIRELVDRIYANVPSGVGEKGKVRLNTAQTDAVLERGAQWAVEQGYGLPADLEAAEEGGALAQADASTVSQKAKGRGQGQVGTLGGGNHFLELQRVERVLHPEAAAAFGLEEEQLVVMIHTGSRGCGHQVATDYIAEMEAAMRKYGITLPDRQLACAPVRSPEGQRYLSAMAAGANFAWANRQLITHWVREAFASVLHRPWEEFGLEVVYDVAHNICKVEEHDVNGRRQKLFIHRKGATRAFPKDHPQVPAKYRAVGQPVIIPGDMGTASYVLVGSEGAMRETFGSTCHGAGRMMSRAAATRKFQAGAVVEKLRGQGIYLKAASREGIVEEAPGAYKNIDDVVRICEGAGLSRIVARLVPVGVMKG